jgi:hypothetical protein
MWGKGFDAAGSRLARLDRNPVAVQQWHADVAALGEVLVPDVEAGQNGRLAQLRGAQLDADGAHEGREPLGERVGKHRTYAAFGSASLVLPNAQSSHWVSASTSLASTVAPHQMRSPGGASR